MTLKLDALTDKQRRAWRMRYHFGWRMERIALELGMTRSGASKVLIRARERLGLPKYRVTVFKTKPRRVRAWSLSHCEEV